MSIALPRLLVLKERLECGDETLLRKALKELDRVHMTVDILKETGIGITVNHLRHHEIVGPIARQLVSKWKECAAVGENSSRSKQNGFATAPYANKGKVHGESVKRPYASNNSRYSSSPSPPPVAKKPKVADKERHSNGKSSSKKKAASSSLGDDNEGNFTAECGSFEQILGLNDATRRSGGSSVKHHESSKNDKKHEKRHERFKEEIDSDDGRTSNSKSRSEGNRKAISLASDADLSKVLPAKLTTDYRPQPQRAMMLDFDDDYAHERGARAVEDADVSQTKSRKLTKIYSGRRNIFLQQVPTLFESCIHVLCDNIDALGYTGGVPFDILKPVLERATAAQLFQVEEWNPYLLEDTGDVWKAHCNRDFKGSEPDWEEGETWRELYERKMAERDKKLNKLTQMISEQKAAKESALRQAKMALAKAPREVRRRQVKYGTFRKEMQLPGAEEIVQSRKNLDLHMGDKSKLVRRNFSHIYEEEQRQKEQPKNRKEKVAPLMAKSLKMMKMSRGR